jgi:hypothetical protein
MLLPIMINNTTIGAIYMRRQDELSALREVYRYEWEVTLNPKSVGENVFHASGELEHRYSDGALVLTAKVLKEAGIEV